MDEPRRNQLNSSALRYASILLWSLVVTACGTGLDIGLPGRNAIVAGSAAVSVRLNSATVSWTRNSETSTYVVVRSTSSAEPASLNDTADKSVGTVLDAYSRIVCSGTSISCSDTGLSIATDYYYFVYGQRGDTYELVASGSGKTGPTLTGVLGGTSTHLAVSGTTALLSERSAGLLFVDVGSLPTVTRLGRYVASGYVASALVDGSLAYLANGDGGIVVIDFSDPANPRKVGSVATPGGTRRMVKYGSLLYTTDSVDGLSVIDVSTPTSPTWVTSVTVAGVPLAMERSGSHLYLASSADGLNILSLATPLSPTLVRNVPTTGSCADVLIRGSYAYLSTGADGVEIVDISAPAAASIVANFPATASASHVSQDNDYLYLSELTVGVRILDPTNPVALTQVGVYTPSVSGATFSVPVGNHLLVAQRAYFEVADIATPATPTFAARLPGGSGLTVSYFSGGVAGFSFENGGAISATLSASGAFTETNFLPGLSGIPRALAVSDSRLYISRSAEGLDIYDASTFTPTPVGAVDPGNAHTSVLVDDDTAYLAYSAGLRIINVANPAAPTLITTSAGGNITDIGKAGNNLFLADVTGNLRIVDVTNPAAPTQTSFALSSSIRLDVDGNLALVARQADGASFLNITTPTAPVLLSTVTDCVSARGVALSGRYAYVAGTASEDLCFYDVVDPANPVFLGRVQAVGSGNYIHFDSVNETLLFAARGGGLFSFKNVVP